MWHVEEGGLAPDAELSEIALRVGAHADFFEESQPITLARAPGRLDVMGGIADYSGSLVLELPLAAATWVAVQRCAAPTFTFFSTAVEAMSGEAFVTFPLNVLAPEGGPMPHGAARALLGADPRKAWAAHVAGAVVILHHALGRPPDAGFKCWIHSSVPLGKGLSSSAAVEVATLTALVALLGVAVDGREMALLAQRIENVIVGAPCGVMDPMTSACGARDRLLSLLCQPAEPRGQVALPPELELWGLDSGIRHQVSGADYTSVRVGAFMGYRILAEAAGLAVRVTDPGRVVVDDGRFGGYLANVTPSAWQARFRDCVPTVLEGRSFLERYGGITDDVTRVDPARTYAVRAATEHPIYEHHRVELYASLLEGGARSDRSRALLGELMYQAHESYGACGLGSGGTDRLVQLVRDAGPGAGLYGAKITGGGSGGTVAVLARAGSGEAVRRIVEQYEQETGRRAAIFGGSSPGAIAYGTRRLVAS